MLLRLFSKVLDFTRISTEVLTPIMALWWIVTVLHFSKESFSCLEVAGVDRSSFWGSAYHFILHLLNISVDLSRTIIDRIIFTLFSTVLPTWAKDTMWAASLAISISVRQTGLEVGRIDLIGQSELRQVIDWWDREAPLLDKAKWLVLFIRALGREIALGIYLLIWVPAIPFRMWLVRGVGEILAYFVRHLRRLDIDLTAPAAYESYEYRMLRRIACILVVFPTVMVSSTMIILIIAVLGMISCK